MMIWKRNLKENNHYFMKKSFLILVIILLTGCNQAVEKPISDYNEPVLIPIQPSQTLGSFFAELDPNINVYALDIIEEPDRSGRVAFSPPINDATEAIVQYEIAYQKNIDTLTQLMSVSSPNMDEQFDELRDKEIVELDKLAAQERTVDTVVINGACVTGPKNIVDDLAKKMSDSSFLLIKLPKC